jgi:hypothetical protein
MAVIKHSSKYLSFFVILWPSVSFYARWSRYNTTGIEKQKKNIFLEAIVYFIGTVGAKD